MEKAFERELDWAGLPVIPTMTRLPCRSQHCGTSACGPMADSWRDNIRLRLRHKQEPPRWLRDGLAASR